MAPNAPVTPATRILKIIADHHLSCCLYVAARLNIADMLAASPRTVEELAAPNGSHAPALYRILRALASEGFFEETVPGTFALTTAATALQTDTPLSLKPYIQAALGEHYPAFGQLLYSVQTGNTAFDRFYGMGLWQYYESHPQEGRNFMNAMTALSQFQHPAIVAAYDFSSFRTMVDIGGGNGALLLAILQANSLLKGIIFDQPYVLRQTARAINDHELADRCGTQAGSFFEEIPPGADAYIMKYISHDWSDEDVVRIFSNCAQAMRRGSKLLVVDAVIPEEMPHILVSLWMWRCWWLPAGGNVPLKSFKG